MVEDLCMDCCEREAALVDDEMHMCIQCAYDTHWCSEEATDMERLAQANCGAAFEIGRLQAHLDLILRAERLEELLRAELELEQVSYRLDAIGQKTDELKRRLGSVE